MPIEIGDSTATVRSKINAVLTDAGLDPADNVDTTAATALLNEAAIGAGVAVSFYDRQPEAEFRERFATLEAGVGGGFTLLSNIAAADGNSLIAQSLGSDATYGTFYDMRGAIPFMRNIDGCPIDLPRELITGVGGQQSGTILARIQNTTADAAFAAGAGIFIVEPFSNDSTDPSRTVEQTMTAFDAIIAKVTGLGVVALMTNSLYRYDSNANDTKLQAYAAQALTRHNPNNGVVVADTYGATKSAELAVPGSILQSVDRTHLTVRGDMLVSQILLDALVGAYGTQLPARDLMARPGTTVGPAFTSAATPTGYTLALPSGAVATLEADGRIKVVLAKVASASPGTFQITRTWNTTGLVPGSSQIELLWPVEFEAGNAGVRQARIDTQAYKAGFSPMPGLADGVVGTTTEANGAVFFNEGNSLLIRTDLVTFPVDGTRLISLHKVEFLPNVDINTTFYVSPPAFYVKP